MKKSELDRSTDIVMTIPIFIMDKITTEIILIIGLFNLTLFNIGFKLTEMTSLRILYLWWMVKIPQIWKNKTVKPVIIGQNRLVLLPWNDPLKTPLLIHGESTQTVYSAYLCSNTKNVNK